MRSHYNQLLLALLSFSLLACKPEQPRKKNIKEQQELIHAIHDSLEKTVAHHQLSGLAVRLIENNETTIDLSTGFADIGRQIPITDSTIYRIASISKTITALAVMHLYEQGKADLDKDVEVYLGWPLRNPEYPETPITLRMLMSHRSSIRDGKGYGKFSSDMNTKNTYIKDLFTPGGSYYSEDMFANHAPGTYFSYTNCTWGLIASVVEAIAGTTLEDYCIENLFKPMEMDARFDPSGIPNTNNIAVLYRATNGEWEPQTDHFKGQRPQPKTDSTYIPGTNGLLYGPQGSLRCSVNDLEKIARLFWNKGVYKGQQILKAITLEEMTHPEYLYNGANGDTWEGFFLSYGLGLHLITATPKKDDIFPGTKMLGHPGIAYGLLSDLYFECDNKRAVIFVTNGSKNEFKYGSESSFYQPEEDVFRHLKKLLLKQPENHSMGSREASSGND